MAPVAQSLSNASLLDRLSCNIFITNFPPTVSAKDLWGTCSQYGTVMDVYIPLKLTKLGKRFAFARFRKVSNVDFLIKNLRSVWLGSFHLFANVARFNRENSSGSTQKTSNFNPSPAQQYNGSKPSFASILKDPVVGKCQEDPVMVLERGVVNFDGDSVLLGCVKEFQSLPNIHIACFNEGFSGLKFSYLGGYRALKSKIEWCGLILKASFFVLGPNPTSKGLLANRGKIATVRAKEVTGWIPDFDFGDDNSSTSDDASEKSSDANLNWMDEKNTEVVQDSYQRHENDNACDGNRNATSFKEPSIDSHEQVPSSSGEPFGLDDLISKHQKKQDAVLPEKVLTDPVFPPGFTPLNSVNETTGMEHATNYSSPIQSHKEASNIVLDEGSKASKSCNNSLNGSYQDQADSRVRSSNPSNGFSILERFQEFINIGQAMGYDMKGSKKDFQKIIYSIGENNGQRWQILQISRLKLYGELCLLILLQFRLEVDLEESLIGIDLRLDQGVGLPDDVLNRSKFAQPDWDHVPLVDQFPRVLSSDLSRNLEAVVSSDEIKKAIWDYGSDKTPGPDGFTLDFFKKYWSIVGNDVILTVKEFFFTGSIPNGCNPSFITLIPKCKAKKEKALLFKIDFQKAFDSVRWDHLDDILNKFGFGHTWRRWIKSCLYSSKASILVNGSPTDEFSFHRGLRQGDPLSPFLFILVMESLHISFQRLIDRGVNVGANMKRVSSWDVVINKVTAKLSSWKAKTLSVGGRLTLVKFVLGAIPTYFMSLFKVPEGVLKRLESLQNSFFLGADLGDKKITWVSWR
nr:RNA-directed DNA polymerase, eukaryota, reverse transcriptase zinc-binding domain protein [Tanacetum cinerariifolium]